jgi:hypothetical protein
VQEQVDELRNLYVVRNNFMFIFRSDNQIGLFGGRACFQAPCRYAVDATTCEIRIAEVSLD